MVSFWPFKSDDTSAASFEKVLRQLSDKITETNALNDRYRQRRRKWKVLWSLYAVFGYMIIAAIFVLVVRFENWNVIEYIVVAGGPPFIYGVRYGLDSYYAYRASKSQNQLNELVKQRETAIKRLKAATKYDSTQKLLEKYGGAPKGQEQEKNLNSSQKQIRKRNSDIGQSTQSAQQFGRTNFAPPPTANIQNKVPQIPPGTRPHSSAGFQTRPNDISPSKENSVVLKEVGEDFAPNAFPMPSQPPPIARHPSNYATEGPKWYDRILDVLLGEDESQAKNRIVLICNQCRLVNGQAPPSARTLEEVGRWRCGGCHAWNGVESEEKRILAEISQKAPKNESTEHERLTALAESESSESKHENTDAREGETVEDGEADSSSSFDAPPASSTRSKARQKVQA